MDNHSPTKPVVVSLTTIPTRLADGHELGIKSCINSLVNQVFDGEYEIHLNVPLIHARSGEPYIIPDWILQEEKVKIFRTEDLGPCTKSIPTIARLTDPETIIIICDDDLVYRPNMVATQVENQTKWPEAAVGYDGMRSRDENGHHARHFGDVRDYFCNSNYRDTKVDILQHYKTVSYKRRYFEADFFEFVEKYKNWNDDLLFAAYFSSKYRDRIATYKADEDTEFTKLEEWQRLGGVTTFPVLRHTNHESFEGCNLIRQQARAEDDLPELYHFIDNGYKRTQ